MEKVHQRLELMVEELEEMQRIRLYTHKETKDILTMRKQHEQKLQSAPDVNVFTEYINYERLLLDDIRHRRATHKVLEKKENIEFKIIKRIKKLYELAFQKFPDDIPLFLAFLKFCKKVNYVNAATDVVESTLKRHSNNPLIWQVAAQWHGQECNDRHTALKILLKALAVHKDNKALYKETIKLQLAEAVRVTNSEGSSTLTKCVKQIEKTVNALLENIKDCEVNIQLLNMLEQYPFTAEIQNKVMEKLQKDYSDNESVWHFLAQRERTKAQPTNGECEMALAKVPTPKARLEACFAKYREGLQTLSAESRPKLWALFLNFLLELNDNDHQGGATVLKSDTLKAVLEDMSREHCLNEKFYMSWLDIKEEEEGDEEAMLQIAEKATEDVPYSVELWLVRLNLHITKNAPLSHLQKTFDIGRRALKGNALPLWSIMLRYHYLHSCNDSIANFFEEGITDVEEISDPLKSEYLEWLALTEGLPVARNVYQRISSLLPYSKNLHLKMIDLETRCIDVDLKELENVHKTACEQFGKQDVDVWMNYIDFVTYYYGKKAEIINDIKDIRQQALKSLPEELTCLFETEYNVVAKKIPSTADESTSGT